MKAEGQNNPFLYIISRFLLIMKSQSFRNAIFSPSTFQNIIKTQILSRDTAANLRHVAFSMLEEIFAIPKQAGLHCAFVQTLNLFTCRTETRSDLVLKICTCKCFGEGFHVRPIWGFGEGCCFMHEDYTLVRV